MTKQMPAKELRESIADFAAGLIERRDEARADAQKRPSDNWAWAMELAYRDAIASLHIWTSGEFGQANKDQPSPYTPTEENKP